MINGVFYSKAGSPKSSKIKLAGAGGIAAMAFALPAFGQYQIQAIGLYDVPLHQQSNGYSYNDAVGINSAGQVLGWADRFLADGSDNGQDAWIYNPTTNSSIAIGLVDAAHTDVNGRVLNGPTPGGLNNLGQAIGFAFRFSGTDTNQGQDAWYYDPATNASTQIGLTDAGHTATDGTSINNPTAINDAGLIVGNAVRFSGEDSTGEESWLYNTNTHSTQVIGLTDAAHTAISTGYANNYVGLLSQNGLAAGYSDRYDGDTYMGQDTWLYNANTNATTIIGPTDAAHTASDGSRNSIPVAINAAGKVVGGASYYSVSLGSPVSGGHAWVYDPATGITSILPGLTDALHTGSDGTTLNGPSAINASGMVAGSAARFISGGIAGYDAWVYDPSLSTTFPLIFSVSTDGSADSLVTYLGDDGVALGTYELYDGNIDDGQRIFRWSESSGFADLGSLVDGGLDANGWASLATILAANGTPDLTGNGLLAGSSGTPQEFSSGLPSILPAIDGPTSGEAAFLLVPDSVPEPTTLVLASLAAMTLSRRPRKR